MVLTFLDARFGIGDLNFAVAVTRSGRATPSFGRVLDIRCAFPVYKTGAILPMLTTYHLPNGDFLTVYVDGSITSSQTRKIQAMAEKPIKNPIAGHG